MELPPLAPFLLLLVEQAHIPMFGLLVVLVFLQKLTRVPFALTLVKTVLTQLSVLVLVVEEEVELIQPLPHVLVLVHQPVLFGALVSDGSRHAAVLAVVLPILTLLADLRMERIHVAMGPVWLFLQQVILALTAKLSPHKSPGILQTWVT